MNRVATAFAAMSLLALDVRSVRAAELPTVLFAQEQEVQLALAAGPEHLRADADVYVFGKDGYRKARSGTNGFTCLVNRDGNQRGDNVLRPTCWDAQGSRTIVPVMLRVGELIARSVSADEIQRQIDSGFAAGLFSSPQKAGIAYMLRGDVEFDRSTGSITGTRFPPHYMIYAPKVTNADIGMDVADLESEFALPSVYAGYSGGERTAYIIVLAAPRAAH
jgi:hypothetical protein